MPMAWVKLAPQGPVPEHSELPSTIFVCMAGGVRIPVHAGHQFRSMPGHDSGPCRATIPVDAGGGGVTRVNRRYRGFFFRWEGELRWGKRGYPCARFVRFCGSRPKASVIGR